MNRLMQWRGVLHRTTWESDAADDRAPLIGFFWAGIWLFWLLGPLVDSLQMLDRPRGWIGAASIVLFAALYLWHWVKRWQIFGGAVMGPEIERRRASLLRYSGLLILSLIAMFSIGQSGAATLVFFGVSAMWTFSIPVAVAISASVGMSYVVMSVAVPGWQVDTGLLISLTFATIATSAGRVAGGRARQLEASRRENARLAVDEERNRMARDLHDILGHSLTVITVKAELAGKLIDVDPMRAHAEIADLERLSRDALADVRRAVTGFREVTLSGELARAREGLRAAGIRAELPTATDEVPSDLREVFAWTVREGVTNVIRHSEASTCRIQITSSSLTVCDDGVGAVTSRSKGNGLLGLSERAMSVGAQLITESLLPRGFSLTMTAASTPTGARPVPERAASS
ncbi:MAG: sensor histidine kinase [Actinomycetota bacterium]|nr:sensor histidine kinase [Actinomycetota bacterium]